MSYQIKCDHCGHTKTAYAQTLNVHLLQAFIALCAFYINRKRPAGIAELDLDPVQYTNFQKLQYFGLVDRTPKGYVPTRNGFAFYYGEARIPVTVYTMESEVLPESHEAVRESAKARQRVFIHEIIRTHYVQRPEWQAQASPQASLFA